MVQTERHTMRTVVCATLAHALLLVAAPVLAQDQTSPPASPAQSATATPTTTQTVPTLLGSKITGLKLLDKNGENIGSIRDLLVTGDRVQQWTCPALVERDWLIQRQLFRTEPG